MSVTTGGCVCGHRAHEPGMCVPPPEVKRCTCCEGVPMSQEATWVVRERSAARYQKQLRGVCDCTHKLHTANVCWGDSLAEPGHLCYCDRHWGLRPGETRGRETSLWARGRDVLLFGTVGGIIGAGLVALVGALI